ncbi:MAG: hypothetical protein RQ731_07510 [Anaerosomatales bacterium]|nr:hypothetical protein [Anaerosomatales bacterium]MDT8434583.1 hypothetical protein [Anaerosomatales bacterium]
MPINIMIGMLALLVALVLYTWGALSAFRVRSLTRKSVSLIWVGVAFDVIATAMMAIQAKGLVNDLHTYLAFIGLGGMALVAGLGSWAISQDREQLLATLSRVVLAPWAVWVFVFVWGMIERGSERLL